MPPSAIKAGEEKGPVNDGENEEAGACKGPWLFVGVECWRNTWRASGARDGKKVRSFGCVKSGGAIKGIWI